MKKPQLLDVHTHVQFHAYEEDGAEVIKRALDQKIWLVNVGTQKDTSAEAVRVANLYKEGVYATIGLHPIHTEKSYHDEKELGTWNFEPRTGEKGFVSRAEDFDYEYYKNLGQDKKVVAIGECGLDYYRATSGKRHETWKKQKNIFEKHIKLSHEIKKPLMIHCREAFSDLISILDSKFSILNSTKPGIIHFFSGTVDDAKRLLELGFSFSFGGVITFTRDYENQIKYIPLDRILLETDAPYVSPVPYRGKRNEPAYIVEIAKKLAELKGVTFNEVAEKTTENAFKIFKYI